MQLSVRREALDRRDLRAVDLHAEQRARLGRGAVDDNGAGATRRRVAADVRPGQAEAGRAGRRRATRAARARARASCRSRSARRVAPQASLRRASRYGSVARAYTADARRRDGLASVAVAELREIHEDELERWVATMRTAVDETDIAEGYLDWKRQARATVWLPGDRGGRRCRRRDRHRWLARARGRRARRGASRIGGTRSRRRRGAAPGPLGLGARARVRGADGTGRRRPTTGRSPGRNGAASSRSGATRGSCST